MEAKKSKDGVAGSTVVAFELIEFEGEEYPALEILTPGGETVFAIGRYLYTRYRKKGPPEVTWHRAEIQTVPAHKVRIVPDTE